MRVCERNVFVKAFLQIHLNEKGKKENDILPTKILDISQNDIISASLNTLSNVEASSASHNYCVSANIWYIERITLQTSYALFSNCKFFGLSGKDIKEIRNERKCSEFDTSCTYINFSSWILQYLCVACHWKIYYLCLLINNYH